MKTKIFSLVSLVALTVLVACSTTEPVSKPTINALEVGLGNSKIAYIGGDLHIEAEIEAMGRIELITIMLHPEEGEGDEILVSYTEFAGLRNTTFHKHIDIPEGTEPGEYHFHLTVTDKEGNQTAVESDVSIQELMD